MQNYEKIIPAGGSTGTSLNLQKRILKLQKTVSLNGKVILDCGCGPGDYLRELLKLGYDAYGLEYDNISVINFQEENPLYKNRICQGDLEDMKFPDNSFDLTLFNEVLEHVPNDGKAISEAFRILNKNGLIAIFSPNRLYPFEAHTVKLKATNRSLPIYTPFIPYIPMPIGKKFFTYWARNYWPFELQKLVQSRGFKIIHTGFVWQTFENNSSIQPRNIAKAVSLFRKIANLLEKAPILQIFGISQFILAQKLE
jgi:ubiquinone/menaquinone biosynthesis C-methylase UbiE